MKLYWIPIVVCFGLLLDSTASAHEARIELGGFRTVSNRFNIPNPGGSRVWVNRDSLRPYVRAELQFQVSERGSLRLMLAPLQTNYSFVSSGTTAYNGVTFPANTPLKVTYRFHSYRLGYLYRLLQNEAFWLQVGGVLKVRDAKIELEGGWQRSAYTNVGVVPLLNLGLGWRIHGPWELRFDIDGAAASQGRAFDGSLEARYRLNEEGTGVSAGLRVLEGGADNEKVNTFALIHYAFLAFRYGF